MEPNKHFIRSNKPKLIEFLCTDASFILQHVEKKGLITRREYNILSQKIDQDEEKGTIGLLDKIMNKGEEHCKGFTSLLGEDELLETFPPLKRLLPPPTAPQQVALRPPVTGAWGQSVVSYAGIVANDAPEEEDCYPMTARPRGLCLIINNYEFDGPFSNRKGTEQDAVSLRRVFQWLHFRVEERNDLTSHRMVAVLNRYAEMDHSAYDAVVVCVLSHGEEGRVIGVDGHTVKIKDISKPFTRNRSLVGKPKIFFIQACQGKEVQRGHVVEDDGPQDQRGHVVEEDGPQDQQVKDLEDDGYEDDGYKDDAYNPLVMKRSLAIEADILIGMSTVEECRSFRYTSTGSIYIQALCRALESRCPKKEDLLTILTHVNREVSKWNYSDFKQMPQPKFTLRKKLVLTVD